MEDERWKSKAKCIPAHLYGELEGATILDVPIVPLSPAEELTELVGNELPCSDCTVWELHPQNDNETVSCHPRILKAARRRLLRVIRRVNSK